MTVKDIKKNLPYGYKILQKMCKMVKVPVKVINQPEFFRLYSWTEAREQVFSDWMLDYLYTTSKARRELMLCPEKNKKQIRSAVNEFVLNYGWMIKN